jgi:hypothetical protein
MTGKVNPCPLEAENQHGRCADTDSQGSDQLQVHLGFVILW